MTSRKSTTTSAAQAPVSAFNQAVFLASAGLPTDLPPAGPPEIAFVGRSNVGKSSVINALAQRHRLAFTSRTPGRTQTINFFDLGDRGRLADLPGYGYAQVPQPLRQSWEALISGYLEQRTTLAGIVIIVDARRPFTEPDMQLVSWVAPLARQRLWRLLVLLSKSDKLTQKERAAALSGAKETLVRIGLGPNCESLLFSAHAGTGVAEARVILNDWLAHATPIDKKTPR